ncbi:MAG: hypothetical protein HY052_06450 [Proteobacteria bacterium]|nr:hypothetical protein [Pseudomonadota bacterium]
MRASCSTFSQVLKLIPRIEFAKQAKDTSAEHTAKAVDQSEPSLLPLVCIFSKSGP